MRTHSRASSVIGPSDSRSSAAPESCLTSSSSASTSSLERPRDSRARRLQSQPDHLPCRPSERQYVLAVDHVASYLTIVVKKTGKARVQWSRRGSNSHAPEDTAHFEAARVPFYHGAVGCRELLLRFVRSQMNRARFELPRKVWETSSPLSYGSVSGCGSGRARTPACRLEAGRSVRLSYGPASGQ